MLLHTDGDRAGADRSIPRGAVLVLSLELGLFRHRSGFFRDAYVWSVTPDPFDIARAVACRQPDRKTEHRHAAHRSSVGMPRSGVERSVTHSFLTSERALRADTLRNIRTSLPLDLKDAVVIGATRALGR